MINENTTTHSRYMYIHMYILNCLNMISHSTKLKLIVFVFIDMGLNDCPYLN